MFRSLALGTILGGLTAFVWSSISWEVVGWHEKVMERFDRQDEVSAVIASHAPKDGTYLLPMARPDPSLSADENRQAEAAVMEQFQRGPIVVAAVRRGGFGSFTRAILLQALSLMAAALLLTYLWLQTSGLSYARSVVFLGIAGLAGSAIVDLPNWNWWGFSGTYTAVDMADAAITWLIAGLVIAKVARPTGDSAAPSR